MFFFYPETKGKTLEEIDGLFGSMSEGDVESRGENNPEGRDTRASSVGGDITTPLDEESVLVAGKD